MTAPDAGAFWEKFRGTAENKPTAPVIEIVERRPGGADPDDPFDVIVPNDVRINGVSLLVSGDDPLTVDRIDVRGGRDVVKVTCTFLARRVIFGHEDGAR